MSAELLDQVQARFAGAVRSVRDRDGLPEIELTTASLREVLTALRDDARWCFNMLVDLVAIDYSEYPGHAGERFGLVYNLKSLFTGRRLLLRVMLPEEKPVVDSVHDLYKNADWLEREAFDQMGVEFRGHPNQKRILNHIEFVGHPLRKDYPITRRQWLTESDDLKDEMEMRLKAKGYL